jgi:hypothetical protein
LLQTIGNLICIVTMRIKFMLPIAFLGIACHNTNPEQGSGGKKVDQQTTLSSSGIVDSAKAIIDQSVALKKQLNHGEISEADFQERNNSLMATYKVLYGSLSPADTTAVSKHRLTKEKEIPQDSTKKAKTQKWE